MKLILLFLLSFLSLSCKRNDFDLDNPNPVKFVEQLKDRTYSKYEFGENGEKLWTKMPSFGKRHIAQLLELAKDTTLVCPSHHFPINPVSSIPPYRVGDGKTCIMISEYLLWCVEGIMLQKRFGSLVPFLVDRSHAEPTRLTGKQILQVRALYLKWFEVQYKAGQLGESPLPGTNYLWM